MTRKLSISISALAASLLVPVTAGHAQTTAPAPAAPAEPAAPVGDGQAAGPGVGEVDFFVIQDAFGELALTGKAKMDPFRRADPNWGPYGRLILIDAAA